MTPERGFCRILGMGRTIRTVAGGFAYHVINRANARMRIFDKPKDYEAFEQILVEAVRRVKMRLLAYCVMPNHWHLVLWPREDGDLSTFVGWLTLTHTQRWHAHRHSEVRATCIKGVSSRFWWSRTNISGRFAATWSGMPCVRFVPAGRGWRWSSLWRREFGDAECRRFCRNGPSTCPRTGYAA